jgi:H+/Cl- antiporter ClcA
MSATCELQLEELKIMEIFVYCIVYWFLSAFAAFILIHKSNQQLHTLQNTSSGDIDALSISFGIVFGAIWIPFVLPLALAVFLGCKSSIHINKMLLKFSV